MKAELNERVLEDDYPLHWGYLYVVNGKPFKNLPDFKTIQQMRTALVNAGVAQEPVEVKSCDIAGRDLWEHVV